MLELELCTIVKYNTCHKFESPHSSSKNQHTSSHRKLTSLISEFRQLEKELETLTQSLCEEVALNNAVSNSAGSSTVTSPSDSACLGEPPTMYQAGPVYIAGPAGTAGAAGTVAGTVAGTAYPSLTSSSILSPPSSTALAQTSVSPTETTVTVAGTRDVGDAEMLEPKPEPGSNDTSNSNSESPNRGLLISLSCCRILC